MWQLTQVATFFFLKFNALKNFRKIFAKLFCKFINKFYVCTVNVYQTKFVLFFL